MKRQLLALAFLLASLPSFAADEPQVILRAEAAPKQIHIGDRVALTIAAAYSGPVEPAEQKFGAAAGDFEILAARTLNGKPDQTGHRSVVYALALTTFSTGTVSIPALPIVFRKSDGTYVEARTTPISVTVKSILAEQGDKGGFRPAKGLYNVRSYWWVWVLLGGILVGLLAWLWSQRARKGVAAIEKREPLLSPEDEALRALDALQGEPVSDETLKEYYVRLSRILRRYIERRYGVSALEMTTAELVSAIRQIDLPLTASMTFREFIDNADLVKFAKLMPNPEEIPADAGRVRSFVDATTPKPVVTAQAAAEEVPPL